MTHASDRSPRKLYRLWSVPLLLGGLTFFSEGIREDTLHRAVFGAGMVLMGIVAFRHNLLDSSEIGKRDTAVMLCGVLLCLVATALVLVR